MDFTLTGFMESAGGLALKGALAAAFLDFIFGVFAAFRDDVFSLDAVAAFVRKHLAGRVFPIGVLAFVGYMTGDLVMNTAAAGALTAYAVETMGSVYASITVKPPTPAEAIGSIPND